MKKLLRDQVRAVAAVTKRRLFATDILLDHFSASSVRGFLLLAMAFLPLRAFCQDDAAYVKVATERSEKIVKNLGITDSVQYRQVLNEIVHQYVNLKAVHAQYEAKENNGRAAALSTLHQQFIKGLRQHLNDRQLEQVKDGMTYSVLPKTYTAFQEMIPALTAKQKERIYTWLVEARELAMDEGSSDDKHKMFGKYKGRINNYLSAEGYDLKKETAAWQQRIKEQQNKK
ncbi:DUF3826 domain-containing protein [Chitinophaga horti]|uniref:DUF3826 domain-containing protein n=1 Tax=Chitinophaga horti TaxID=2920382 RepID=A0ABY6JAZ7_9BACT|nr:DUF3826 domain-containing protein [Chitinophaga horti]UYQ95552.1 DUF3826 domain-containing protein [Chitinophaga horti]